MRGAVVVASGILALGLWRVYSGMGSRQNSALEILTTEAAAIGAQLMGAPAANMDISQTGLDAIAKREGFSATKYRDASGYSIGYGHFIRPGESFTEPMPQWRAMELLRADAKIAADAVRAYVKVPLTQNQFDALTSLTYNIGVGAFKGSTLLRLLNAGDYAGAAAQFARWNKSQGAVLAALDARRASESAQFLA